MVLSSLFAPRKILFKGEWYHVEHVDRLRGVVEIKGDICYVPGDKRYIKRRLTDWLKEQARKEISDKAHFYAKQVGKKVNRVSIKDTSSQWGSCSARQNLSFSWRLMMAPPSVLEYVVAHEVAHMVHMNHSKEFWALVADLYPEYKVAMAWLKREGRSLFKILPKRR